VLTLIISFYNTLHFIYAMNHAQSSLLSILYTPSHHLVLPCLRRGYSQISTQTVTRPTKQPISKSTQTSHVPLTTSKTKKRPKDNASTLTTSKVHESSKLLTYSATSKRQVPLRPLTKKLIAKADAAIKIKSTIEASTRRKTPRLSSQNPPTPTPLKDYFERPSSTSLDPTLQRDNGVTERQWSARTKVVTGIFCTMIAIWGVGFQQYDDMGLPHREHCFSPVSHSSASFFSKCIPHLDSKDTD